MLTAILPVRSLLLAIFMLMTGSGFLSTLVSVQLERAGNSPLFIGLVGTAYFLGLVVGSLRVSRIIRRVGHIRAFAAFVSLLSASTLTYAIHLDPLLWGGLRFINGLCVAGVFVCLESWLNERAESEARGSVLAGYMIALYSGQALGQFLLTVNEATPSMPFLLASILISLSAIPVILTRISAPPPDEGAALPVRALYAISPLGVVGATITGVMLGAFYAMGAVYVRRLGMGLSATAVFMSSVILGGVALQWPLGRLSDLLDRRRVIVGVLAGAVAASLGTAMIGAPGISLLVFGALFGGLSFALYPLCVAHTNDHLAPEQRVAASGGLVLLYSVGAAAGPMAGAVAMTLTGASGLFFFIALCAGGALAFALWRQAKTLPVPAGLQQNYQILPRTTPMSATLDPLAGDQPQEM
jgi:MFS family permease